MFGKRRIDKNADDKELFLFLQGGDKKSFTIIYEKYNRMVYALAFRYLKGQDMAEDAVQHVFTKLWESHSELEVTVSMKNYLYTMTKNYVLNTIRNHNSIVEKNYAIAQQEEVYEDNLLELLEQKELMEAFHRAINNLPEQKKIVCLYKIEGRLSNQEIAEKMNLSIHTVKTHYAQSIDLLKEQMKKFMIIVFFIILFS